MRTGAERGNRVQRAGTFGWGVIERMSCVIKLLPVPKSAVDFYDFEEFERLIAAARTTDWRAELIVLLGGEAGLRSGEMVALEWTDIDFHAQGSGAERGAAIGVAGAGGVDEGRTSPFRALDAPTGRGAPYSPSSTWGACAVSG
jgi:integrase